MTNDEAFEREYNALFRRRGADMKHLADCEDVWNAACRHVAALSAAPTPPAATQVPSGRPEHSIACPHCMVAAGEPCIWPETTVGAYRLLSHKARTQSAPPAAQQIGGVE